MSEAVLMNPQLTDRVIIFLNERLAAIDPSWRENPAVATPINDLVYWQMMAQTGTSTRYGLESTILINPSDFDALLWTAQIRHHYYGDPDESLSEEEKKKWRIDELLKILTGFGLPLMIPDTSVPAGWIVWLGKRPERGT